MAEPGLVSSAWYNGQVETKAKTEADRERLARYYEASLNLLRAQGLEPDAVAVELRDKVLSGEISLEQSIELARERTLAELEHRQELQHSALSMGGG